MKREFINEQVIGDYKVRTFHDDNVESPREWDNVTTMLCFHNRYNLGDKNPYNSNEFNGWDEMEQRIKEDYKRYMIKPLYLYDHSGITISTSPFSCNWDSGQVGFVLIEEKKWKMCMGETEVTIESLDKIIENEVKTYDKYLRGDVYGFEVVKVTKCDLGHEHEEHVESQWGYYDEDECMSEGLSVVKYYEKELV